MKKSQLDKLIKEEVSKVLKENIGGELWGKDAFSNAITNLLRSKPSLNHHELSTFYGEFLEGVEEALSELTSVHKDQSSYRAQRTYLG